MQRRTEVAGLVQKGLNQYVHMSERFDRVPAEKLKATQLDRTVQKALFVCHHTNATSNSCTVWRVSDRTRTVLLLGAAANGPVRLAEPARLEWGLSG
jgi:hypothetical protein